MLKPALLLRERRRVLMTSPEGSTTVCCSPISYYEPARVGSETHDVQEPFALRGAVAYGVGCKHGHRSHNCWLITE